MFDTLLLELDKKKHEDENNLKNQYKKFLDDFKKYEESLKKENNIKEEDEILYGRPYKG
ncbi:hypothetical protein [Paenibacillus glucanolyticus]|uniref:hypothetical protein n=1 Tax=Paenibacillus glucanolyticus TaxID=59843 RepID=UPI0034CF1E80